MSIIPAEPAPVTIERILEVLDQVAERQKETDRLLKEGERRHAETDRLLDRLVEEREQEREQELERRQKKRERRQQERERRQQERERRQQERERRQQERERHQKEAVERRNAIDRQMKETDRRLQRAEDLFTSQWGRLVESLVEGDLVRLLRDRGVAVEVVAPRVRLGCASWGEREVDLLATNGTEAVAVEVKTTLRARDVDRFLDLLAHPPLLRHIRGRRLYGAVAYLRAHEGTPRYAERKGLFVIRATGNSASIVNPAAFRPRDFHPPAN